MNVSQPVWGLSQSTKIEEEEEEDGFSLRLAHLTGSQIQVNVCLGFILQQNVLTLSFS